MSSQQPNIGLRQIFEYELRRKLSLKSKQTTSEMVMLNNNFKFYDINNIGKVDKSGFVKTFIKLGLLPKVSLSSKVGLFWNCEFCKLLLKQSVYDLH